MATPLNKILPELVEILDKFRRSRCTALFVFNPSAVEDEFCEQILGEVFDYVVGVKRKKPSGEVFLDFGILAERPAAAPQGAGTQMGPGWSPPVSDAAGARDAGGAIATGTGDLDMGRKVS